MAWADHCSFGGREYETMKPRSFLFDGSSFKATDPWQGWMFEDTHVDEDEISVLTAYETVPWLYRAVDLRARAVASMPRALMRGDEDVSKEASYQRITDGMAQRLYMTEVALCLTASAYWLLERNVYGKNVTPRWVVPGTMKPIIAPPTGLTGFRRQVGAIQQDWPLERVVYFWLPGMKGEVGPGLAPASVALAAAGVLRNLDLFTEGFFKRGAIKATLLTVEGNPQQGEMDKLEAWWKKMLAGVKNAWNSVAIRSTVKPVVIGSSIEETTADKMTALKREDVATALGIPHSLLFSNAANYATAREDTRHFIQRTVVPECEMIAEVVNKQLLVRDGLTLVFSPDQLDEMQEDEAQRATSLKALTDAKVPLKLAMEILGYDLTEEQWAELEEAAEEPEPQPVPPQLQPFTGGQAPEAENMEEPGPDEAAMGELRKWQRKAAKRGKPVDFESGVLSPAWQAVIKARMETDFSSTFDFLKGAREKAEKRLMERMVKVLAKYWGLSAEGVVSGAGLPAEFQQELLRIIETELTLAAEEETLRTGLAIGIGFDPAAASVAAQTWAREYSYELVKGLTDVTRKVVAGAVTRFTETPGMTVGEVRDLLATAFGEQRAEAIATTEVTRAYSEAQNAYQAMMDEQGILMEREWSTSSDELVCVVCGPLEGKPEGIWASEFPKGPPAHPNCRCGLSLVYVGRKK